MTSDSTRANNVGLLPRRPSKRHVSRVSSPYILSPALYLPYLPPVSLLSISISPFQANKPVPPETPDRHLHHSQHWPTRPAPTLPPDLPHNSRALVPDRPPFRLLPHLHPQGPPLGHHPQCRRPRSRRLDLAPVPKRQGRPQVLPRLPARHHGHLLVATVRHARPP